MIQVELGMTDNHAQNAALVLLDLAENMEDENRKYAEQGMPPLHPPACIRDTRQVAEAIWNSLNL